MKYMKKKVCSNSFLAFLMAFVIFILVMVSGTGFSLKFGVWHGSSIKEIIKNNGMYEEFENMTVIMVDKKLEDTNAEWFNDNEKLKEVKLDMVNIMLDALLEEKSYVSLGNMVDDILEGVTEECHQLTEDILDEIEKSKEDFEAKDNPLVQEIVSKYNIEATEDFYASINESAKHVDGLEEHYDEIMSELDTEILKPMEEDKEKLTADLENGINEILNECYASDGYRQFKEADRYINTASAVLSGVTYGTAAAAIILMALMFLLYKEGIYGAFKNFAIVFGISGVMFLLTSFIRNAANFVISLGGTESINEASAELGYDVMALIDRILKIVFQPFMVTAIVLFVIMAVCIILSIVLKKKWRINNEGMFK